ncbi:VOC family protein [Anaeromicropila herbilytica]|uniref:Glyoxalase n=1 Tax=Anaeromicropila herbilytica TaxID=2785025 RepID=A0A7R7EPD6_9FIRM|nr:VOC family protein [Anaeromicropila herbilytica]BCN32591.1 glyoxalase [Anaeromicropila herbilytica]
MKLKNILFVVNDIEISKTFYRDLFGLMVLADFGENVVLTEGLVLQERKLWEKFIERKIVIGGNDAELYFEENDIDGFLTKLENSDFPIEYLNKCIEHDWGQRVIRIYDPDRHVIEIGESLEYVARRYLKTGMTVEQVAKKTQLPLSQVELIGKAYNNTKDDKNADDKIVQDIAI